MTELMNILRKSYDNADFLDFLRKIREKVTKLSDHFRKLTYKNRKNILGILKFSIHDKLTTNLAKLRNILGRCWKYLKKF